MEKLYNSQMQEVPIPLLPQLFSSVISITKHRIRMEVMKDISF